MAYRHKTNAKADRSIFRNTASPKHTRTINIAPRVSRGGIRL